MIVSTSLFNTDIVYNATLLSTKEIRLSMRVDCTIVWECERQFSMSPKTTGVRSRSPSEDSSCGETGIFTAKANTFPLISIFWAEGRLDRKLNTATWNLERIYFFFFWIYLQISWDLNLKLATLIVQTSQLSSSFISNEYQLN